MAPYTRLEILVEYPFFEKIRYLLKDYPVREEQTAYDLDVTHTILLPQAQKDALIAAVNECTAGRAIVSELDTMFLPERVEK